MSAPDPAVLDRVRKLLALAGSPNAHEAANAAARAQALVTRHRLEAWLAAEDAVAADPDPITDGRDAPIAVARRLRKWKVALGAALADVNGCVAWVWARGADEALCVVGRERDRAWVRLLWDALAQRIEWASATEAGQGAAPKSSGSERSFPGLAAAGDVRSETGDAGGKPQTSRQGVEGAGRDRAWHEAFRIGVVDTIADRLACTDDLGEALPPAALVRIDQHAAAHAAAIERFVDEHLSRGKGRNLRVKARAYEAGRRAGADLALPGRGSPEPGR